MLARVGVLLLPLLAPLAQLRLVLQVHPTPVGELPPPVTEKRPRLRRRTLLTLVGPLRPPPLFSFLRFAPGWVLDLFVTALAPTILLTLFLIIVHPS